MPKRKGNKPQIIYEYIEVLAVELNKRFGDQANTKDILGHLVERGMVEKKRLRNYMIIHDFDNLLVSNKGNRTATFMDLSIKYDICESKVQNVVYKDRKKSKLSENVSMA